MNIAINTRFLIANQLEGIGNYTLQIVRDLVVQHPNHHFYLIYDRKTTPLIRQSNVTNIDLFPPARHPILWFIWFEISLPFVLKKYKIDKFISPDGYLSLSTKTPTLLVVHDLAYLEYPHHLPKLVRWYYRYFTPKYIRKANSVVTVSKFVKNHLIHAFSTPSQKINVSHNFAKDIFQPISNEKKKLVRNQYTNDCYFFLYVGAIHPRKNILRLLKGFEKFKNDTHSTIKLLLIGRKAWKYKDLEYFLEKSPHQKDVIWIPGISSADLVTIMGAAFALTYPSLFEGFGIPIIEAQKMGIPVITSNVSSMPEVVGEGGIQVNPERVEDVANAMKSLYNHPHLHKELIEKGFKNIERFNRNEAIKPFSNWINQLTIDN